MLSRDGPGISGSYYVAIHPIPRLPYLCMQEPLQRAEQIVQFLRVPTSILPFTGTGETHGTSIEIVRDLMSAEAHTGFFARTLVAHTGPLDDYFVHIPAHWRLFPSYWNVE